MEIKQIRNASNKITFAGKTFLLDPWLKEKYSLGALSDIPGLPYKVDDPVKMQLQAPFFDLPMPAEEVLSGVDYYIVTHIHFDHVDVAEDGTVGAPLHKDVPVFVQNEADAAVFKKSGFQDVRVLTEAGLEVDGITLRKAPARHGTIIPCGPSMGVVFQAKEEKTLYVSGDTVWYPGVEETLKKYNPAVVTVNACAAELSDCGRLIMDDEDVECVAKTVPNAKIFVTHMDNVPHASITRRDMRGLLARRQVTNYVMPADGESVKF